MSVQEMILQNSHDRSITTTRTLGAVGMILSPMLLFASFFFANESSPRPVSDALLAALGGVLYLLGATASATALRRIRATGSGKGALVLYVVQLTGLLLAMCFDVLENAAPQLRETSLYFITDMAYPFSHMLMNIVGITIVRAGVWRGWRRIPAFLVGLALPSFIALSAAVGRENAGFIFPLMVTLGFFTLGLAVFTTKQNT